MTIPKAKISNIVYLAICVLGIMAFFMVGIYPNMHAMEEFEEETVTLAQQVQAQELLYPIYRQLIKEVQQPVPTELALPEPEPLPQGDFNRINELFHELGQQSNLDFLSAVPDAQSYLEDIGHLTMHVSFKGDYFNFRKLLLDLCMQPYLESIEQLRIETEEAEKIIYLKVRLLQS